MQSMAWARLIELTHLFRDFLHCHCRRYHILHSHPATSFHFAFYPLNMLCIDYRNLYIDRVPFQAQVDVYVTLVGRQSSENTNVLFYLPLRVIFFNVFASKSNAIHIFLPARLLHCLRKLFQFYPLVCVLRSILYLR